MGPIVISKSKLPIIAEIVAAIITDGHIQARKVKNGLKYGYVGFFSDDKNQLIRFQKNVKKLIKIKPKIRKWGQRKNGRSTGCIISSSEFSKVLVDYGAPFGSKVSREFYFPKWIKNANSKIITSFLRTSFDCDGGINYDKNGKRWEIKYFMYKEKNLAKNCISYLENIRKLLLKFGIKSYKLHIYYRYVRPKDGKSIEGWRILIRDKVSIVNYSRFIGFNIQKKKERLREAVKWAFN